MKVMRISLGSGIIKVQGLAKMDKILTAIEDFGIDLDLLDTMEPSYDKLYEIYKAIRTYRFAVGYLKSLKTDMAEKNHEV